MDSFKFGIIADPHIGKRHLQGKAAEVRRRDFAAAWLWSCREMVSRRVDFVLLTGDLTDARNPLELDRSTARDGLQLLLENQVSTYAIYGNHDGLHYRDGYAFVHELEDLGLLSVVDEGNTCFYVKPDPDLPEISPDIATVRILGLPWQGPSTRRDLAEMNDRRLESEPWYEDDFTVLMAHCGIEGLVPSLSPDSVPPGDFWGLQPQIGFVALGHIHQPYQDHMVCMPGPMEFGSFKEAEHERSGPVVVTVSEAKVADEQGGKWGVTSIEKLIYPDRRKWFKMEFDACGGKPQVLQTTDGLADALIGLVPPAWKDAICRIVLVGAREKGARYSTSTANIGKLVAEKLGEHGLAPLWLDVVDETEGAVQVLEHHDAGAVAAIEKRVLERELAEDAKLALRVLDMLLGGSSSQEIAQEL